MDYIIFSILRPFSEYGVSPVQVLAMNSAWNDFLDIRTGELLWGSGIFNLKLGKRHLTGAMNGRYYAFDALTGEMANGIDFDYLEVYDDEFFVGKRNDMFFICDANGKMLSSNFYRDVAIYDEIGFGLREGKWRWLSRKNLIEIGEPFFADNIIGHASGVATTINEDGTMKAWRLDGEIKFERDVLELGRFYYGASPCRFVGDELTYYVGKDGKVLMGGFLEGQEFKNGICVVKMVDGVLAYANSQGKIIRAGLIEAHEFSDGMGRCIDIESGFGYCDENGYMIEAPGANGGKDFTEGLAAVEVCRGEWTFIDKSGKMVFPDKRFKDCEEFSDGISVVLLENDKRNAINKDGEFLFKENYASLQYIGQGYFVAVRDMDIDSVNVSRDFSQIMYLNVNGEAFRSFKELAIKNFIDKIL